FDMIYGQGVSREGSLLDVAVDLNIVKKSGAWFSYGDERIGQGRENAKKYFKEHPETYKEVEAKVFEEMKKTDVSKFTATASEKNADMDVDTDLDMDVDFEDVDVEDIAENQDIEE
ncbi:MAG: DNA recombination/repair protein RecA, partial [Clostridiales bacterium]